MKGSIDLGTLKTIAMDFLDWMKGKTTLTKRRGWFIRYNAWGFPSKFPLKRTLCYSITKTDHLQDRLD
ncbi:hypothetical protein B7701_03645 [Streptococcus mitis]|uniref:Uncharacterized protein n=1 Tax=Streptococcus mitis TaxID=28037 RepID=A0AAX0NAP4_STRMT|nr:hypothetical protein B7701_03645 [Streptococcus mitis]